MKFLFVCFTLFSVGCSKVDVGLKYVDTAVWWKITDYIDYQAPQKKKARVISDAMVNRFLKENLEKMGALLEKFGQDKNVEAFYSKFTDLLMNSVVQQKSEIADFINLIEIHEYKSLIKNYSKKIKEQEERLQKQDLMLKEFSEKYIDLIQELIGDLEDNQTKEIEIFFQNTTYEFQDDIAQKKTYLELMKSTEGDQKKLLTLGLEFFLENKKFQSPLLYASKKKFVTEGIQMTQKIFDGLTEKQKIKFHKRVIEFSNSFKVWISDHS